MRLVAALGLSAALAACGPARIVASSDGGGCGSGCAAGSSCVNGSCYATSCTGQPCEPSQVCVSGGCVDTVCVGVACGAGEICVGGECLATSCGSLLCPPNEVCASGQCTSSACVGVSCPSGALCARGACLPTSCGPVACAPGAVCSGGVCVGVSCVGVTCPLGTACAAGRCAVADAGEPADAGPPDAGPPDAGAPDSGPSFCAGGCDSPPGPCYGAGSCVAGACDYPVLAGTSCSGADVCQQYACNAAGACAATGPVADGTPAGPSALCCAGAATPDDTPSNCGGCGVACAVSQPNETAVCSGSCGSVCKPGFAPYGQYACVNWAGHFQVNDPGCTACENGNPFASGGGCACPTGFSQSAGYRVIDDCSGNHGSEVYFCETQGFSAQSPWGDAYEQDDPVPTGMGCRTPNPYTGSCACPAGASATGYRVTVDTPKAPGTFLGSTLVLCSPGSPPQTFGGAYQVDDPVPSGYPCRVANPYTGACSCPPGLGAQEQIRTLVDTPKAPGTLIGSRIYLCSQ